MTRKKLAYLLTGGCAAVFLCGLLIHQHQSPSLSTDLERGVIETNYSDSSDSSGIQIFCNSNIVAETAHDPANLLIQNAESNQSTCKVFLTLDDTGECIYESDEIPAGYKVEAATLQKELPVGTHPCTASFHMLHEDGTDRSVVNVGVKVTILHES